MDYSDRNGGTSYKIANYPHNTELTGNNGRSEYLLYGEKDMDNGYAGEQRSSSFGNHYNKEPVQGQRIAPTWPEVGGSGDRGRYSLSSLQQELEHVNSPTADRNSTQGGNRPYDIDRSSERTALHDEPMNGGSGVLPGHAPLSNPNDRFRYVNAGSPAPSSIHSRSVNDTFVNSQWPLDPVSRAVLSPVRSPSVDPKWRNPDLREVIDFLSHQNDVVKANAAAYLQHLCYMDDNVKAQTRALRGIPPLVDLVDSPIAEVHRAACGALRNLSYGRANDDNKREIARSGCITGLVRLLRKSTDAEVREVITGVLWNLSSCVDIKRVVIDEGVKSIVDSVIIQTTGWDRVHGGTSPQARVDYLTTVFRNASGALRNVSSDGEYARKRLRECEGLVDSVIVVIRAAIRNCDIDNKSVENCVCILRNLSYACQEVIDPDYLRKRNPQLVEHRDDSSSVGCFGKKKGGTGGGRSSGGKDVNQNQSLMQPQSSHPCRGMELLWQPSIVQLYLKLLDDSSNLETLEAAAGAIQNLTACEWAPSVEIRAAVRKEKGLSIIVDLLGINSDRVVCAAATALRNLALDERNKELIGKYAMAKLVSKLPSPREPVELTPSNDTIAAVEATLYEVIKSSSTFARSLMNEGGIERLMYIVKSSHGTFSDKVVRFASLLLRKLWRFGEFHEEYKKKGWKQSDFMSAGGGTPSPAISYSASGSGRSQPSSAENTINRMNMGQSGPSVGGYNDRTMIIQRPVGTGHLPPYMTDSTTSLNVHALPPFPHGQPPCDDDEGYNRGVWTQQSVYPNGAGVSYPETDVWRDDWGNNRKDNIPMSEVRDSTHEYNQPSRTDSRAQLLFSTQIIAPASHPSDIYHRDAPRSDSYITGGSRISYRTGSAVEGNGPPAFQNGYDPQGFEGQERVSSYADRHPLVSDPYMEDNYPIEQQHDMYTGSGSQDMRSYRGHGQFNDQSNPPGEGVTFGPYQDQGVVPLSSQQELLHDREPLYTKVNKTNQYSELKVDGFDNHHAMPLDVDSWV